MTNAIWILLLMFVFHVIADYNLQGILASMKQKSWWAENVTNSKMGMYANDYKCALWTHSFIWTFFIMLPIIYIMGFQITLPIAAMFILNMICHYVIDDAKANKLTINLCEDQCLHIYQILATWIYFII